MHDVVQLAGRKLPDRLLYPGADRVQRRNLKRNSEHGLRNGVQFEPARVSDGLLSAILTNWKITRAAVCCYCASAPLPSALVGRDPDTKLADLRHRPANRHPEGGRPDDHLEPRSRRQIASADKLLGGPESRQRSAGIGLAAGLRLGAGTRPAAELLRRYLRADCNDVAAFVASLLKRRYDWRCAVVLAAPSMLAERS